MLRILMTIHSFPQKMNFNSHSDLFPANFRFPFLLFLKLQTLSYISKLVGWISSQNWLLPIGCSPLVSSHPGGTGGTGGVPPSPRPQGGTAPQQTYQSSQAGQTAGASQQGSSGLELLLLAFMCMYIYISYVYVNKQVNKYQNIYIYI